MRFFPATVQAIIIAITASNKSIATGAASPVAGAVTVASSVIVVSAPDADSTST